MAITLRSYQERGVSDIRAAFNEGASAPLYVAPTGSGKTVLFCYIAQRARELGAKVWIIVHRRELLLQTSRALDQFGVRHGLVTAGVRVEHHAQIQVCSKDTLVRRLDQLADVDLIVVDEGHHTIAGSWLTVVRSRPDARLLGVTATPLRLDGRGLGLRSGGVFDRLVLGPTVQELIDDGWLCPPVLYGPPMVAQLEGVEKGRDGDYNRKALADVMDKSVITGDAVAHYTRVCPGASSLAFCVSIKHAEHVAQQFCDAGYRFEVVDGTMTPARRARLISDLGVGNINGLTSCDIVSEGTDIPIVTAAILLRPTHSLGLYLQQVGRVLRPVFPGGIAPETAALRRASIAASSKPRAYILDHVGSVYRHYLPETPRQWFLDTPPKSRRRKQDDDDDVPLKQCQHCYACHAPAPACLACGHVYEVQSRQIATVEGDLSQVTAESLAAQIEAKRKREEIGRAKTRGDLEALARRRGFRPGWVDHILRARGNRGGAYAKVRFDG